ncbi:MAG: EAL domain-containing protein [Eubacterium sp.]|nr:EAL domain-containing protein [Eubacterium sp.]
MATQEMIFNKIAEALLMDYTSVYYVNIVTNEYFWYSVHQEFHNLKIEQGGDDFFRNIIRDAKQVVYPDDMHIFCEDIQKDKLLAAFQKGMMQNIEYRLVIDGKPVWHRLRMIRGLDNEKEDDYIVLGVENFDKEHKAKEAAKRASLEREIYNQIAESLAEHYDTLYYVDVETGHYFEISSTNAYQDLHIPTVGEDFFAESRRNIRRCIHPEDQDALSRMLFRDVMVRNLENRSIFTTSYRLIMGGQVNYVRLSEIWAKDGKHMIVALENINDEVLAQRALTESQKKSVTYGQIADMLASHFDVIYYVDSSNGSYLVFTENSIFGEEGIREEGVNFFADAVYNAENVIYPEDRERILTLLGKDYLISALETRKQMIADYRMVIDGKIHYTRMTTIWAADRVHFIICVENRDEDVQKEKEHLQALKMANEMARRDELTGTRNKNAYHEAEAELQEEIDAHEADSFAVVLCDINDLKMINDTQGHKAGDSFIRRSCKMICTIFAHSPVFRIGGDEFVVILKGDDFTHREELLSELKRRIENNLNTGEGPVVASGMAEYQSLEDRSVEDVFDRADSRMYEEKNRLKKMKLLQESYSMKKENVTQIPPERRLMLDSLYAAFSLVSEGTYVYLCDMKYDFSRWSAAAVDAFGLPSEYMYGAGDLWEERIHPEDREVYRKGIDDIFMGNAAGHDMQYRARRTDGSYDVCTCRGVVVRDPNGDPDYFAGTIRNHGIQGHVDTLTGLRNQYGFFEDLDMNLHKGTEMIVSIVGISKFSEINEVYGYHFGNRVLQLFARKLYDFVGNTGHVYRIDGTKFAVISHSMTVQGVSNGYKRFRDFFRSDFEVEGRRILLDLNCGMLSLIHANIDSQTVYACLNFAYGESKLKKQGDLVEFHNDLSDGSRQRVEQLHAIRASIMHGYKGFFLLYQPVVDADTEELIGAEALLRWRSREYGVVPPDQFIPLLESDPLFPELGEWILREALKTAKKVLKRNPEFMINVNLSYTQLEKPDFVDLVLRALDEVGYPPEHLCLEVTERCRLLDMDLLKNVISSLKSHGVVIALDDFGTGFSSIGLVKELPFDIIKIDRSFVQRIEEDPMERKLMEHFSSLASIFGAKVCVEGIETEGMRDILQHFSVKSLQGYYYARPLQVEDFLKWERKHTE